MTNGLQSRLRAILNVCFSNDSFFLVPRDDKNRGDGYLTSENREAKIRVGFSEDTLLVIWFYWPNLRFLERKIGVYRDNYIRKDGNNLSTGIADVNRDKRAENLNTSTTNVD